MTVVLDASAVLAVIQDEPGQEIVIDALSDGPLISAANLAEVVAKLAEAEWPEERIHDAIDPFGIEVVALDETQAYVTGLLRQATRSRGLSLGDRACLALAMHTGASVLTTDRQWQGIALNPPIEVVVIRG